MSELHDLHAEQNVLGGVLLAPRTLDRLLTEVRLAPAHFYRPSHAAVYTAMTGLHADGHGIDSETVRYRLEEAHGKLPDTAAAELEMLAGPVPDVGNLPSYAHRVVDLARWRRRREALQEQLAAVERLDDEAYTQATLHGETEQAGHDGLLTPDALAGRWVDWYDHSSKNVITTPWEEINEGLFGGLRPGDTTILAGHSAMGKSTAGDQLLEHAKEKHDLTGCLYPNEMSEIDRVSRLLAARAGVPFRRIMRRELTPDESRRTLKAAARLPFAMQPCAGWNADAICAHLRRYKWGVAFIDLATRIPARQTADWDYISGAITDAARQSGTHVILAVQLNRERSTSAERPMPALRDLRNTGAWEADARNVLFVHRREELDRETETAVLHDDGVIQLAKVSNGRQGAAQRVFLNYRRMRFDPLEHEQQARQPAGIGEF